MLLLKHHKKYDAITSKQNEKKYKNLKRKISEKNKLATSKTKKPKKNYDIVFVKQVPLHLGDRLKKQTKDDDKVFLKQVPLHPRDARTKKEN